MASTGQDMADLQRVIALVKSLLNAQLKDILRSEGLAVSGVKAILQERIIDRLGQFFHSGRTDRYDALKGYIYATAQHQMPSTPTQSSATYQQPQSAPSTYAQQTVPPFSLPMTPSHSFSTGRLSFKDSPFYSIIEPLTPVVECKVRESTRDSVILKVVLSALNAARIQNDPSLRVMVYCAADSGLTQYTKSDITFPHQVELKANLDDVKANLRGLKNRPGSTRPADITNFIRKKAGYVNQVAMTYALTQKKYFMVINLVRKHTVEELVNQLQARKTLSAEQVIREMKNKAEDADIVATSAVMSLKCPLSTLRIAVPCRSTICLHTQCFDASSFLQLQEQAPTWTCPVCNKATNFEALQIDQYVDNILKSTPPNLDQVTVDPDGKWHIGRDDDNPVLGGNPPPPTGGGEDDLIEIQDSRLATLKEEPSTTPMTLHSTPSVQTGEFLFAQSTSRPTPNNKRPASQVIDLTVSDDEDEEPCRPAKRPHIQPSPNQYSNRCSDFVSRSSVSNANFGHTSQSSSSSPAANSFYYDA
ncbi:MIZ zinc finger protein [Histoplasma capsulatum var. duboisii H88]|uniref:MIZ zinc finger protein n=1 Tax=Ajellomyces capsulatus (strain H88) TaxID=544711 RepID=A0A8A1LCX9_AJEC8|nr:MIZ zinc finger protein [Histoplasma capsulatum var. duboisii H88]